MVQFIAPPDPSYWLWDGGNRGESEILASCYRESLGLAFSENLNSIAFPAISCGVYRFPVEAAAQIAMTTVFGELEKQDTDMEVLFVCFEKKTERALSKQLELVGNTI